MARASSKTEPADTLPTPKPGEWQALRGELVALLDQVEGRYVEIEQPDPAFQGLAERVRSLRGQVEAPQPVLGRSEALNTVKRAVDRFSDREDATVHGQQEALNKAIAEIRGKKGARPASAEAEERQPANSEFRELNTLVGGLSGRLERLEGELKAQHTGNGVREVASQVEQLTHVVELLAGAVGESDR